MQKCRCGRYDVWNGISWQGHYCDYKESPPKQQEKREQRRPDKPADNSGAQSEVSASPLSGCLGCLGLLVIIGAVWGIDGFSYILKAVIAVVMVTAQELVIWIESR